MYYYMYILGSSWVKVRVSVFALGVMILWDLVIYDLYVPCTPNYVGLAETIIFMGILGVIYYESLWKKSILLTSTCAVLILKKRLCLVSFIVHSNKLVDNVNQNIPWLKGKECCLSGCNLIDQ